MRNCTMQVSPFGHREKNATLGAKWGLFRASEGCCRRLCNSFFLSSYNCFFLFVATPLSCVCVCVSECKVLLAVYGRQGGCA